MHVDRGRVTAPIVTRPVMRARRRRPDLEDAAPAGVAGALSVPPRCAISRGMAGVVHLVKICVGAEAVEDLVAWQAHGAATDAEGHPMHVTRMWPRREAELLAGGSLYWVFKGLILARQRLLRLDPREGGDGVTRCALVLERDVIRTEPAPRRPFQGWRYLADGDAPADLSATRAGDDALPPELRAALSEIGVR